MSFRLPTPLEVRQQIEKVGYSVHPTEDRRVANDVDEYQLQMAMKFEYLVAGRVAEVSGKYQPDKELAYPVYVNGYECLLIPVKTAKRKTETGWSLRGPTIPFESKYEPWTEEVWEYLQDNEKPFQFAYKDASSKRIMEAAVEYTFNGFYWNLKPTDNRGSKWVPFKSHSLRRCRTLTLKTLYKFNPWQLLFYGGWEDEDMTKEPESMQHYTFLEINESYYTLLILILQAEQFIEKLMVPFEKLHSLKFEQFLIQHRIHKNEGTNIE